MGTVVLGVALLTVLLGISAVLVRRPLGYALTLALALWELVWLTPPLRPMTFLSEPILASLLVLGILSTGWCLLALRRTT